MNDKNTNTAQEKIISMFEDIAPTYDKANRILSMGIDVKWRNIACLESFKIIESTLLKNLENKQIKIADIACGTGDMIVAWRKMAKNKNLKLDITGVDPSHNMLKIAKEKLQNDENSVVNFKIAQCNDLNLEDNSIDILSIAYGLRNVVDRKKGISEFSRVLKKDGIVVLLEFVNDEKPSFFARIMKFYTNKILPFIGGIISKNRQAYTYLPESINDFATKEVLVNEFKDCGFILKFHKSYSANISTLMIFQKI